MAALCNRTCGRCTDGAWWKATPEPRSDGLRRIQAMADMDFGIEVTPSPRHLP